MSANIPTPRAGNDDGGSCPSNIIKAHSNCMGRGAIDKAPELKALLQSSGEGCLEYDDSQRKDGSAQHLRELLGAREGVEPGRIVLGGSGLEWIPTLAASLGVRTIIRAEGDFHGYDRYAHLQGLRRITVPVHPVTRMLDPVAVAEAVRGQESAMLCLTFAATNPLQTPILRAHVEAAVAANADVIVLVDGAYWQYGDQYPLATLADEFPQVIYLQVASKSLFLPGARLSWLVPSTRHATRIAETTAPYPLNTVAIGQATKLLERPALLRSLRVEQARARDHLQTALPRLGLPTIGGPGPWALFKWPINAKTLVADLERRFGILVQQQILAPLDDRWVRVSATVIEEAEQIVDAIALLMGERPLA